MSVRSRVSLASILRSAGLCAALPVALSAAEPSAEAVARATAASAAYPAVAGQPAVRFDPRRPIPASGSVRDIESLTTAPEGMMMQRRNNFYRRDTQGQNAPGTGLYRWASSGHFSNYDEALAGDYRRVPELLVLKNGQPVKDADTWRKTRRAEVVDLLETHMFGKVPANAPKVTWTATKTTNADGSVTTVATGRYVNADGTPLASAAPATPAAGTAPAAGAPAAAPARGGRGGPAIDGIQVTYTVPANATGRVPLVQAQGPNGAAVLAAGFGTINVQGTPPNVSTGRPDDWGAIRKQAWMMSRALDHLETDTTVDAHQVALTGHSIGGKIALLRAALDERIGLVFASCSGEGGASLMRRDWGETIDDIAQLSPQNYCGNFQQWVANWSAMPVDAHMIVALMAPRPAFITGGTDDQWSDPVGVFWAGYHASPVYRLLGKRALESDRIPAPNAFAGGDLLFYNHIGGHITTPEETAKYLELVKTHFRVKGR